MLYTLIIQSSLVLLLFSCSDNRQIEGISVNNPQTNYDSVKTKSNFINWIKDSALITKNNLENLNPSAIINSKIEEDSSSYQIDLSFNNYKCKNIESIRDARAKSLCLLLEANNYKLVYPNNLSFKYIETYSPSPFDTFNYEIYYELNDIIIINSNERQVVEVHLNIQRGNLLSADTTINMIKK